MYVFGGRKGKNVVGPGYDYVQVYDPKTNTWASSDNGTMKPLSDPRGGMGKALYVKGLFVMFGGETNLAPGSYPGITSS